MIDFVDKTSTQSGTPINRENMMALQEYQFENVVFEENSIIKTNGKNEVETTTFTADGYTKEFVANGRSIKIQITFTPNGYERRLI